MHQMLHVMQQHVSTPIEIVVCFVGGWLIIEPNLGKPKSTRSTTRISSIAKGFYLDDTHLQNLGDDGVQFEIVNQCLNDIVLVPAGWPHQVLGLWRC